MFKPCTGCKTKTACKKAGKCLATRKAPPKSTTKTKRQYKRK